MKVLFINSVYGHGSTGGIIQQLGKALEEQGDCYMVAYGRGDKMDDPHCYYIGSLLDAYLHAGLSRITDRAGFFSKRATQKLLDFIRGYTPDVIHLHNLHGYYVNIELLFEFLKAEFSGKIIWTLHDCWAFTGHCTHYTYAECEKWKTGCNKCPQKSDYPASWGLDCSCLNYIEKKSLFCGVPNLTIVTVSQWLKGEVEKSFLKDYPIHCAYNGIDTAVFHPVENHVKQELGIQNKKMILLVSDGWTERKGYGCALDVAEKAPADWHFVIVGLSKNQIRKLPDNITGFERIWNQQKLVEFYSAADVFFNPSVEETFGLVTAEAIACGTPAVVMNSTACPEPLCGHGMVLKERNPYEITFFIAHAFSLKETYVWFPLSVEKMVRGYMSIYYEKQEIPLCKQINYHS